MEKAGFVDIARHDERWLGIDDCARYPLFTPALLDTMRKAIAPERHGAVARALVFTARSRRAAYSTRVGRIGRPTCPAAYVRRRSPLPDHRTVLPMIWASSASDALPLPASFTSAAGA